MRIKSKKNLNFGGRLDSRLKKQDYMRKGDAGWVFKFLGWEKDDRTRRR